MQLRVVCRPYEPVYPLERGAIQSGDLNLVVDHVADFGEAAGDPSVAVVEMSLSKYLSRVGAGDRSWVGLPYFIHRGFRHRSFIVLENSRIGSLQELKGLRIGIGKGWSDTGNTWAREALQEAGLALDDVQWYAGPVDALVDGRALDRRPSSLPSFVDYLAEGDSLVAALESGRIDALTSAFPPERYLSGSGLRRVFRDHRAAEVAYFRRSGVAPLFHVIAVRREIVEDDPSAMQGVYRAFCESWDVWWKLARIAGATPWAVCEREDAARVLGDALAPYGLGPTHRRTVDRLGRVLVEQGIGDTVVDAEVAFSDFLVGRS